MWFIWNPTCGKSGIFANQRSIDVTSHNIANANTEGYSRQESRIADRKTILSILL